MQLLSIETTPSPNCIKLNLDGTISPKALTLQKGSNSPDAPEVAQRLLAIEGVQSVFLIKDFITLTRKGNSDWQPILAKAANVIGVADNADSKLLAQVSQPAQAAENNQSTPASNLGQLEVAVQTFRGIPVQVRVTAADGQQARVSLPERFSQALQRAISATAADYVAERRWEPYQAPAGAPDEVAQLVADEIDSLIDAEELAQIEAAAAHQSDAQPVDHTAQQQALVAQLSHLDWKHRLKALQQLEVTPETFPAVKALLDDEKSTIRRWAAALLGASNLEAAVEPLCRVVRQDSSAIVRRTAGDALSDLGNPSAMPTLIETLADASKLVRWRAARFLNELGDQTAVEPLRRAAEQEAEFDVRVEMMAALERIEGGGDTQLPMWMRLTQGTGSNQPVL
ncbi:virulence factor [Pseudanabaena sp. FACHB-2040]|uniref:virulence factor n=1 Tax=Pseudanabaena sp. FACHB-2040 TaxID=2692859 RepID=UPI001686EE8E|nr:virulence factor [Pseudanabaena sp. FACHB-2040]MBD2258594.1 virulence factor [Pseudanabaena sp. FACHB-2040]